MRKGLINLLFAKIYWIVLFLWIFIFLIFLILYISQNIDENLLNILLTFLNGTLLSIILLIIKSKEDIKIMNLNEKYEKDKNQSLDKISESIKYLKEINENSNKIFDNQTLIFQKIENHLNKIADAYESIEENNTNDILNPPI